MLVLVGDDELVLRHRDLRVDAARWRALRVAVELLQARLRKAHLVGLVVDREVRPVAELRASRRRMRPHAAWKVITHMRRAVSPRIPSRRVFISLAALFVKVIARISFGLTPHAATRCAMRCVSTRVFPSPLLR